MAASAPLPESRSTLDLVQTHSLTSALRLELERLILNGEIKAGERLNETALAARFHISRGPLREALQALGELGLVSFARHRGAFIRRVSLADAVDLYSLRAALEDEVARKLAGRLSSEQAGTLSAIVEQMDRRLDAGERANCYELNLRFHDLLVEYAGNRRLAAMYRRIVKELQLFRLQGLAPEPALAVTTAEHHAILAALKGGQPEDASRAMRQHVDAALRRVEAALLALPDQALSNSVHGETRAH